MAQSLVEAVVKCREQAKGLRVVVDTRKVHALLLQQGEALLLELVVAVIDENNELLVCHQVLLGQRPLDHRLLLEELAFGWQSVCGSNFD